jgi:Domain of unknown function (DUF1707)
VAYGPGQAYPPVVGMGIAPAVNPAWLAASADRERAVGVLRAGFAEGRLTQDELTDRVGRAYAARTYRDLWALTADLPSGPLPVPTGPVYGTLPWHGGFDPNARDINPARAWRSNAALVMTALVIFVLAAIVTLIVSSHGQPAPVVGGYTQQFGEGPGGTVQLVPNITPVGPDAPAGPAQFGPNITQVRPAGHRLFSSAPVPPGP